MDFPEDLKSRTEELKLGVENGPHNTFCGQCHKLDTFISDSEAFLASSDESQRKVSKKSSISIGLRSELVVKSENCAGCNSILKVWDTHILENHKVQSRKFVLKEDYDLYLENDPRNAGWASFTPLSIRTHGADEMALRPGSIYPPRQEVGRICDPRKIDYALLRKWITCCEESHQDTCQQAPLKQTHIPSLVVRYIDLDDWCLVSFMEPPRYVALSYVWGRVPTLLTLQNNVEAFSQPGGLKTQLDSMPRTIRDAMNLTRELGVRYLWVDALCIVQNDLQSKGSQLDHMPLIYGAACFTIAVIDGADANSGIAGVGSEPLKRSVPHVVRFPSKDLTTVTYHYGRMKSLQRKGRGLKPIWSTRAWTMQEHRYSNRIICMQGLASWLCLRTQYLEEVERPSERLEWAATNPSDQRYRLINPSTIQLKPFGELVNEYNQRELSYEEDVVDAFRGTSALLVPVLGPLLFGHPETLFDHAMCWQPAIDSREEFRKRKPTDPKRKIPSWSWMGWFGELDLTLWEVFQDHEIHIFEDMKKVPFLGFDIHIRPTTTFYKLCLTCNRKYPVSNAYNYCRENVTTPNGWNKLEAPKHWHGLQHHYYEREAEKLKIPYRYPITHRAEEHCCESPIYDTTISFTTERLFCPIQIIENNNDNNNALATSMASNTTTTATILSLSHQRIGSLTLHSLFLSATPNPSFHICELIAISQGECPRRRADGSMWGTNWVMGREHPFRDDVDEGIAGGGLYRFVNVLAVEWSEGVAYRKGVGRVRWEDWVKGVERLEVGDRRVDVVLG